MSIYKSYSIDQVEALLSNYLVSSWSYSKVAAFARNEKAFEMNYIFGIYSRKSSTTIAGEAYHHALQYYFSSLKDGKVPPSFAELEISAFSYIDEVPGNRWKLQKKTPTVEEAIADAKKVTADLLRNFYEETGVYTEEMQQVEAVEIYADEWLRVNGVDIPLPCHLKIDLVLLLKDGRRVIVDHKSKRSFTDDEEIALSIGTQAITYVLGYEAKTGTRVDAIWFIENKYSRNKDGSPQLFNCKVEMDDNARHLYQALLYEPLKRMIEAVGDPDHVYLINPFDTLTDMAELYDFWARTMICEVDEFNVEESKRGLVANRLRKIRDASLKTISPTVIRNFKDNATKFIQYDLSATDMNNQQRVEHVLSRFGTPGQVAHTFTGYSSDTFLIEVGAGVKVAAIQRMALDIANALDVSNVRISRDLVVYEGKSYLSIDFAKRREGDLYFDEADLKGTRIPLGRDNFGNTIVWDTDNNSTPHMLVCGATGSGKSVLLKSTIEYGRRSDIGRIYIFDPKKDFEALANQPGVEWYSEISDIEAAMQLLVEEMEYRVKNKISEKTLVIFDEFADAIANSRKGNELKIYKEVFDGMTKSGDAKTKRVHVGTDKSLAENMRILLQKGRSSGFRIIAATQRASVKIMSGDAKVNFPVRICLRVPTKTDSEVVIDEPGAEALAGRGDALLVSPEYLQTVRFQAYYKP